MTTSDAQRVMALLKEATGLEGPEAVEWLERHRQSVEALALLERYRGRVPSMAIASFKHMGAAKHLLLEQREIFLQSAKTQRALDAAAEKRKRDAEAARIEAKAKREHELREQIAANSTELVDLMKKKGDGAPDR